jgi:hypothetical protein
LNSKMGPLCLLSPTLWAWWFHLFLLLLPILSTFCHGTYYGLNMKYPPKRLVYWRLVPSFQLGLDWEGANFITESIDEFIAERAIRRRVLLLLSLLPVCHEPPCSDTCSLLWCSASPQAQNQWSQTIMDWNHWNCEPK